MQRITITAQDITIPADVPRDKRKTYIENYLAVSKETGRFFIFAGDQKIEHLNADFYGTNIHPDANNPQHLFDIAQHGEIGALATHPGLIARYAPQYSGINYIAKLNGKTNLLKAQEHDPLSRRWLMVDHIAHMAHEAQLPIRGVGYTIYLGSEHESMMLAQAAQIIYHAHQHGLLALLWLYPRGKAVHNETDGMLLAGACGVGTSLGADIIKIKPPQSDATHASSEWLHVATQAAGNSKVICAGGHVMKIQDFLTQLHEQIHTGGTAGCATGRNIFQRSHKDAVRMTKAISAIVYDNQTAQQALTLYKQEI